MNPLTDMNRGGPRGAGASGFTLVELLTVMVILVMLLSLLLPAISAGLERARMVRCSSNLRQIIAACILYATDRDGVTPSVSEGSPWRPDCPYPEWLTVRQATILYTGDPTLMQCPSESVTRYPGTDRQRTFGIDNREYFHSYGGDQFLSRFTWHNNVLSPNSPVRLSNVKWPSRAATYYDGFRFPLISNWGNNRLYSYRHLPEYSHFVVARHRNLRVGNVAMGDGHVTTFDADVNEDIDDLLSPRSENQMTRSPTQHRHLFWRN